MENENELKEYCDEIKEIKVKVEPIEYDVNIDDKKIVLDAVQGGNVKLEELHEKKHVPKHESLDAEDCIVSCKVEVEENCVYVHEFNQDYNTKHDGLLTTENIKVVTANGDILYNCPRCTYTSNSRRNYKQHVRKHDRIKKFACTICQRRFYHKGELEQHMFTHSGQKVFKCSLCDYKVIRKASLNRHMREKHMESGEKPHKCPKCEYKTNDKYYLKQHVILHDDTRPYECEICNKRFKRAYDLKFHGFVHDKEKRYRCACCDYKTKTKTCLEKHSIDKHGGQKPFKCRLCDYGAIREAYINRHMRDKHSETGEKRYNCPKCEYRTNYKYNFKLHEVVHDSSNLLPN